MGQPQRIALWGLWYEDHWMLCGAEPGSGSYDMVQTHTSRADAAAWLKHFDEFDGYEVAPLNAEADAADNMAALMAGQRGGSQSVQS